MKLTIESTEEFVFVDNTPVRVWNGVTEGGLNVYVLVAAVAAPTEADTSELDALQQLPPPAMVKLVMTFTPGAANDGAPPQTPRTPA